MTTIHQQGRGALLLNQEVPNNLQRFIIPVASPSVIHGDGFQTLMQEFRGEGFSAWFNQMFATEPTIITITANVAVLELRIALKNRVRGKWDNRVEGDLPEEFYQMAYVPHVDTRAIFTAAAEYQTFDIHLDLSFLESIGVNYHLLDRFMNKVVIGSEPAELMAIPFPCTAEMRQLVHFIITSEHSPEGHAQMMRSYIKAIVIAALEEVSRKSGVRLPLTKADKAALHQIREMIEVSAPEYLSHDVLLTRVYPHLIEFKLAYGFKRLFGTSPKEYYQKLRFAQAKELLAKGRGVEDVAFMINYQSSTAFIAAFKERFGVTPKQWMKL
jgi:AraC-like DNA-binding protein